MLESLVKYAKDHGLDVEPGFKSKEVRWAIVCDENGRFLEAVELGDAGQKGNRGEMFARCPEMDRGLLQSGGMSHFLVESAQVVALCGDKTGDQKLRVKHDYFVKLLRKAGQETLPELTVLADMLDNTSVLQAIRNRLEEQNAKPTHSVTFRVGDVFPLNSHRWHQWWRDFRKTIVAERSAIRATGRKRKPTRCMRCLVTGDLVEPTTTHLKIEGLAGVGGIASGDVLIGFDKDAFCSYGLQQSLNAAVSEQSAAEYRAALNELLRKHGQRLAGSMVVHWFKKKVMPEDDPLAWLEVGQEQEELNAQQRARQLLESIRTGKRTDLAENEFQALTLSGAGGRVMVRDWMEGQFEELVYNIELWFEDLAIVQRHGGTLARSPKFMAVLGATVRDLKDLPAPFVARMWRVAVRQEPIPQHAMAQALDRVRVAIIKDEPANHPRMGLLKAYHIRKNRNKGGQTMSSDMQPYLNEEHPHPAYHCGRLMAVYARLQRGALGDVGAGVVQRYYAAASATPALVLGRLARLSQFHLNKLEPRLARWYENKLASIWTHLKDESPASLNLEEQSLFALGYYQQMAERKSQEVSAKKEEHNE